MPGAAGSTVGAKGLNAEPHPGTWRENRTAATRILEGPDSAQDKHQKQHAFYKSPCNQSLQGDLIPSAFYDNAATPPKGGRFSVLCASDAGMLPLRRWIYCTLRFYNFLAKLTMRYCQKRRSATVSSGRRIATTGTSCFILSSLRSFSTTSPLMTRRS